MNPIISIIVPCYNQAQYLSEALESVLAQTIENWECVIVNDGSTDNTLEIASEWAEKDSRFIILNKENGGLADARNAGIKASHGKYILPLDADDKIASTYLEKAVGYFENNPTIKVVCCVAKFFGEIDTVIKQIDYSFEGMLFENPFVCSSIYKRSDYNDTIGYNTNMIYGYEDWDFWLSLLREGDNVYRIPEPLFYYRKHAGSMISSSNANKEKCLRQMILNHIDLYDSYLHELISMRGENKRLRDELNVIEHSVTFNLLWKLSFPVRFLKQLLK